MLYYTCTYTIHFMDSSYVFKYCFSYLCCQYNYTLYFNAQFVLLLYAYFGLYVLYYTVYLLHFL